MAPLSRHGAVMGWRSGAARGRENAMTVARRESRWPFPALTEWPEAPVAGWLGIGPVIRIEDFEARGRYVVRAELPGIDPDQGIAVHEGNGVLTDVADEDDVKASYRNGILEVSVGLAAGRTPDHRRDRRLTAHV